MLLKDSIFIIFCDMPVPEEVMRMQLCQHKISLASIEVLVKKKKKGTLNFYCFPRKSFQCRLSCNLSSEARAIC